MNEKTFSTPSAAFTEHPGDYELKITLPGIAKDEIELHIEGRTLTLKTASKHQNPAGFKQVISEFSRDDYAMSADLPDMADPASLTAKVENGVLTISMKKRPETQARKIAIA